jgi:hypothetical protein
MVKSSQRTSMPISRNTVTMPVSWQIGRWPFGAHARIDQDLRDGVLGRRRLLALVGGGEVLDVIDRVVVADVLQGIGDGLDQVFLLDMPPPLPAAQLNLRERFAAMRNLPPFLREIWATSKPLTTASLGLRLIRAFLPIATLYVGKLIIDEAIRLVGLGVGQELAAAWHSGALDHLLGCWGWNSGWRSAPTCWAGWSATSTPCCPSCSPTPPACA